AQTRHQGQGDFRLRLRRGSLRQEPSGRRFRFSAKTLHAQAIDRDGEGEPGVGRAIVAVHNAVALLTRNCETWPIYVRDRAPNKIKQKRKQQDEDECSCGGRLDVWWNEGPQLRI